MTLEETNDKIPEEEVILEDDKCKIIATKDKEFHLECGSEKIKLDESHIYFFKKIIEILEDLDKEN